MLRASTAQIKKQQIGRVEGRTEEEEEGRQHRNEESN